MGAEGLNLISDHNGSGLNFIDFLHFLINQFLIWFFSLFFKSIATNAEGFILCRRP